MFWLFYGVDYIRGAVPSGVVCGLRLLNRFLWASLSASLGGCGVESSRKVPYIQLYTCIPHIHVNVSYIGTRRVEEKLVVRAERQLSVCFPRFVVVFL